MAEHDNPKDPKEQYSLALCYQSGKGVEKNLEKAVYWCNKAAEQGYSQAQHSLAACYHNGTGVNQDLQKAVYWYTKAAEQGNSYAQTNLGVCYDSGTGVSKDLQKAVYWFTKAAEQGIDKAQFNLGLAYRHGEGVKQDFEKAVYWYTKAAEQGNADAKTNLQALLKKRSPSSYSGSTRYRTTSDSGGLGFLGLIFYVIWKIIKGVIIGVIRYFSDDAFDFKGTASRKEWWIKCLLSLLVSYLSIFVFYMFPSLFLPEIAVLIVFFIGLIFVLIPVIAIHVRRMHDIGKRGWWALIPIVGFIMCAFFPEKIEGNPYF